MGGGGGGARVEVINSKGCSRLFVDISSSFRGLQSFEPMSPASSSLIAEPVVRSTGPFSGLVICVTGLSKEARKQVMDATERLGGQYSTNLHPQCTHLVVQSFHGRKFEHALKHGSRNGLFVVTLGWFVDSVRRNVRLNESLYSVKSVGENGMHMDDLNRLVQYAGTENYCLPVGMHEHAKQSDMIEEPHLRFSEKVFKRSVESTLSGHSLYVDLDVSAELRRKVIEAAAGEGATSIDQWFVGCNASHIVCEGPSIRKYLGHSNNLVTPLWVLKTAKEKHVQRLVHISADLARQVGTMLDNAQNGTYGEEIIGDNGPQDALCSKSKASHDERLKIVNLAKNGVRKRRGRRMQTCQTPIRPITPSGLLDSICWSISEPTSTASIYTDSFSAEDASEHHTSVFFDAKGGEGRESEASFVNYSRPLTESEKTELIFKNHFLTILFPVDRFAEMGPCSRTFFSDTGFTCLQVLDHIYAFYQENMLAHEIEVAIHTDSRHADRLRSVYSSKETAERGSVAFKRIDFLGSRKSFEMLKRVAGENNSNVYELLIRA
uniref:BRCT domain-containing protein n=1 Tax=Davidia involucrata TaxID=16924 RepID=A0A5B7BXE9_DAVIN